MNITKVTLGRPNHYNDVIVDLRKIPGKVVFENYDAAVKTVVMTNRSIIDVLPDSTAADFIIVYTQNGNSYYLNKTAHGSTMRPPHVCTNSDGSLEIRGSCAFVCVHDSDDKLIGFVFVKDSTKSYIMMPAGTVESSSENDNDGGYLSTLHKELREETGLEINVLDSEILPISSWNFTANFCGEKHGGITKAFKVIIHENLLPELLKFKSKEIDEVVYISNLMIQNNPLKLSNGVIVSPKVKLSNGKLCDISQHHILPAMKLLGMDITDLIPSYIHNYTITLGN